MKLVEMYSMAEILKQNKQHQTKVAELLSISRPCVIKYMNDTECELHCVLKIGDTFIFRCGRKLKEKEFTLPIVITTVEDEPVKVFNPNLVTKVKNLHKLCSVTEIARRTGESVPVVNEILSG